MNELALLDALELGIIYGIVAFGVFLSFRVLNFPDLSVESTFPMGGAIAAACIVAGMDPWAATTLAALGGAMAGMLTAFLAVQCGILHLLAGILTMMAGYSINLRIMGRPNISLLGEPTIFSPLENWQIDLVYSKPMLLAVLGFLLVIILTRLLLSESGLAMRATGGNAKMLQAAGGNPGVYVYMGIMISNGLVALGGALFAQADGFADVTTGIGTIIFGLAALILGETVFRSRYLWGMLLACLGGSVLYRIAVALALEYDGLAASDLNLITAVLVTLALIAPKLQNAIKEKRENRQQ